ncbi:hypothetical protein BH11BAC3_BH11BAC3_38240 [soil metagenome]
MINRIKNSLGIVAFIFIAISVESCSKESPAPTPNPNVCAGKTIVVTATPAAASACSGNGSIVASASGSSNFTYKLDAAGTYQASGTFNNIAAGSYTVFAKDGDGCENSTAATVATTGTAGPLFTAVKSLVAARCQSCHNATIANGGMNFAVECNIITSKTRIKVRAVDEGTMPQTGPLSQSDKDIISNWITAGGGYTN